LDNKSAFNKLKNNYFLKYLTGDGKIFSIVFFVLIVLILSGIIANYYIDYVKVNWEQFLVKEIEKKQIDIINEFKAKERNLLVNLDKLKKNLKIGLNNTEEVFKHFIKQINLSDYDQFSIEIFAPNGKIVGWNENSIVELENIFPLPSNIGETFFYEKNLIYYLSIIDTFHFQNDDFYIFFSLPIEKKYKLNNKFYNQISLTNSFADLLKSDVKIEFNPYSSPTSNGRKHSVELLNNKNKKIGLVTFDKPTLKNEINNLSNIFSSFQSLLVLLGVVLFAYTLRSDYKKLNSYLAKFFFILIYFLIIRFLLFAFSIPSKFFSGLITDSANFSSTFGYGIVKSPLELLVTNIFVLIICFQFFRFTFNYSISSISNKSKIFTIISVILIFILYPIILRSFAASMRSVVFDSKLNYFKDFDILPEVTILVMNVNILIIGFSFLTLLVGFMLILKKSLFPSSNNFSIKEFLIVVLIFLSTIFLFYFLVPNSLFNLSNLILVNISVFFLYFLIEKHFYRYPTYVIIIAFLGSFNSVFLLNYFDTEKEKDSMRNIAFEINRINEQLIKFYLKDNINKIYSYHTEKNLLLRKDVNFNSLAFITWASSSLHQEELNSFIGIYDRYGKKVGGFNIGYDSPESIKNISGKFNDFTIIDESKNEETSIRISAFSKYFIQAVPQLIIGAGIDFELKKLGGAGFPEFLKSELNILNQSISLEKVKIFQFLNNQLVQVYGDIYPNREQIKHIFRVKLDSVFLDAWTKIRFGDEIYETYIFKSYKNDNEILNVVLVAENKFSWNLFNFFKVFVIHSLLILILVILNLSTRFKHIVLTFKAKLLLLFLVISIFPLTFLGLYNRNVLKENYQFDIKRELKQKLILVEKSFSKLTNIKTNPQDYFRSVYNSLGISFNIFFNNDLIFSTDQQYYNNGLLNKKLNSTVYYNIFYDKFKEFYNIEKIEKYNYVSFYKVVRLDDKEYILNVNQAFNKSTGEIFISEFDIVLFGIYSLTIVIIIFSSTFLANQISAPIQILKKAAEAIGKGDLNVKIEHKEKGEIRELIEGFNKMTEELKNYQKELAEYERESAWKEMAKQVAHEIKNPLTPMKLTLQQLIFIFKEKRDEFDKLFDKVSETILDQIENLNQIVSEFSRFAKMPPSKFEKFDIFSLLNELSNIYLNEKIKIVVSSDMESYIIENDRNQLNRIFINLIRNSIQANATLIKVDFRKSASSLEIYFEDNGKGIAEEFKNKIFDENFSTKKHGMGLGLKIAKKYLNSINGDIVLLNSSEKGTIFKIVLPDEKQ